MSRPVTTPSLRSLAGALALLAAAVLAGCASGSPRPKPAELPPNVDLIGVRQAWHATLAPIAFPLQVHTLGSQVLLASGDGTVVTLDARNGAELGRAGVGAPLSAGVGGDGRMAAVVTRANEVVALAGGRVLWRHRLPTQSYTAPLVAGGRVFVLGADRSLTALDGGNGAKLWSLQRPAEPLVLRQAGVLLPVGNTLVAGLAGRLVGVDPDDGRVLWEAPIASARGTNDVERLVDLVAGDGREGPVICARAFQTAVGCVDTTQGSLRWSKPANGATGLASDDKNLYGAEADGTVMAWNAATGERAWQTERLKWRELTGPLVLGRSVVLGDGTGLVHLLSRQDGSALDRLTTDGSGIAATPVAAGNTLVVVTRAGGVYAYRPD